MREAGTERSKNAMKTKIKKVKEKIKGERNLRREAHSSSSAAKTEDRGVMNS